MWSPLLKYRTHVWYPPVKPHLCKNCGETAPEAFYTSSKSRCRQCILSKYHNDPLHKAAMKEQAAKWQDDNMLQYRLTSASARSARKGIAFDITIEHLEMLWTDCLGLCHYTGKPMVLSKDSKRDSVSIDRLDSGIGYVPGNVVLCRSSCNTMKSDMSEAEFAGAILDLYEWAVTYLGVK